jgi:putative DNA primase/helicase
VTIDLRTGRTYAPHREDYCTKVAACRPKDIPTPLWNAFLARVTARDHDLQCYLKRVAGYCLTGLNTEHVLFFFYGTGANGKGVFLNTLHGIWGDYAVVAAMETFIENRNGDRHPTELAHLWGARIVIAQETEKGRNWAESKIKRLTGGDPITARYMRQDFFDFTPQFKLLIAGNHKPSLRAVDEAIRRRLHLIPFTVTIPKEERDKDFTEKLKPEWPGILYWAVQGCLEWQRVGLAPPKAVADATDEYLREQDKLGQWIEDCCGVDPVYKALSTELYKSWKDWCEGSGLRTTSQKSFSLDLQERGFANGRNEIGLKQFEGLALKGGSYA